jgi:fructuronate reductase
VTITNDVGGFERAKLRLLNGAHSSLAYLGLLAGLETVEQAITHPQLGAFIRHMMENDIRLCVVAPKGMDVSAYIESLLKRFANPRLPHRLAQIAWDGSQKIPFRLLGTISDALAAGRSVANLCIPVAAWMHFIRRKAVLGESATDPLAATLRDLGAACSGEATHDVKLFLSLTQMFPSDLQGQSLFRDGLQNAYRELQRVQSASDLGGVLQPRN